MKHAPGICGRGAPTARATSNGWRRATRSRSRWLCHRMDSTLAFSEGSGPTGSNSRCRWTAQGPSGRSSRAGPGALTRASRPMADGWPTSRSKRAAWKCSCGRFRKAISGSRCRPTAANNPLVKEQRDLLHRERRHLSGRRDRPRRLAERVEAGRALSNRRRYPPGTGIRRHAGWAALSDAALPRKPTPLAHLQLAVGARAIAITFCRPMSSSSSSPLPREASRPFPDSASAVC